MWTTSISVLGFNPDRPVNSIPSARRPCRPIIFLIVIVKHDTISDFRLSANSCEPFSAEIRQFKII